MYFGHYYAEMVHDFGPKAAGHVEWLPKYIRFRMATQVIRDTYDSRDNDSRARRHAGGSLFNWLFLGAETVIVLGLTTTWGYRRSRKGYCETCQRWMTRELTEFEPDKAPQLVEALQTGSARSLAALCAAPAFSTLPNTTVALEVCPSLKEGTARDCPVFLSIKSVAANRGGATLDRFESSKGKVLVRGVTLTSAELPAFAPRFPFLGSYVGRSAVAALVPQVEPEKSEQERAGSFAEIRPVESDYAGRILTRKTALIALAFALGAVVALFAAIGLMAWGGTTAFPSVPAREVAPAVKLFGITLLVLGGVLFLGVVSFFFINPNYFGNRYVRKLARREFSRRAGCVVDPNDPDALFVEIVPKLNWGKLMLETAQDVGFLVLDRGRRQVLFEGDKERCRIPAAAITQCEVEEFVEGKGSAAATRVYYVVLRAAHPTRFWEAPIRQRTGMGKFQSRRRKKAAQQLCDTINEMRSGAPKPVI